MLSDSTKGRTVIFFEGGWAISKNYFCTRTLKIDEKESCKESHLGKSSSSFYYPGAVFDFEKQFSHKLLPTKKFMYNLKMRKTFMPQDIAHLLPPPPSLSLLLLPLPPPPLPPSSSPLPPPPSCPSEKY